MRELLYCDDKLIIARVSIILDGLSFVKIIRYALPGKIDLYHDHEWWLDYCMALEEINSFSP
jgi:hypothetical protein